MTEPQAKFFQLTDTYPLFCAGFGAGKTEALLYCALRDAMEAPTGLIALYEPTYDLVRLILAPRIEEMLVEFGVRYTFNKRDNTISTSTSGWGDFLLRTLDNPARIVGYESYRAHVDEIDTLTQNHATEAWRKIIARNRQRPKGVENPQNRVSAYTTPEGFRFAYDMWVKKPAERRAKGEPEPGYVMVQAATRTNIWLDPNYIPNLRASYPPQLFDAYCEGLFVNLHSGAVYPDFSRTANHAGESIRPGEALHVGMDFNVNAMAAAVCVVRDDLPCALAELANVRDTPTMARLLRERFEGHTITVYPDASGGNTSSKGASVSDLTILQGAGFTIRAPSQNPRVKDRVNAVNALICNDQGVRRLRVNTDACPKLTESLEQQPYDDHGEPDKSTGHDHMNDALGYFLHSRWPLVKPVATHAAMLHVVGR